MQLQHEISHQYLHIPNERCKFVLARKNWWPERITKFTRIEIPIWSKSPWQEDFGKNTDDLYLLRVFHGFDRYRICDPEQGICLNKACSLHIYHRVSLLVSVLCFTASLMSFLLLVLQLIGLVLPGCTCYAGVSLWGDGVLSSIDCYHWWQQLTLALRSNEARHSFWSSCKWTCTSAESLFSNQWPC